MELDPDRLRAAARGWDARADDLTEARAGLRAATTTGLDEAGVEAACLLDAAGRVLAELGADAGRLVDGLLVTSRAAVDADQAVADTLRGLVP